MYVKPSEVLSPKGQVEVLDVLYDGGEGDVSVARIHYRDELNQPFVECTGIRWNGDLRVGSKGMPLSRGYPVWFVIPDEFSECMQKRALELNGDNVQAVVAEIKMAVEAERKRDPHSCRFEYKTKRGLSVSQVDMIFSELQYAGIMGGFTTDSYVVDSEGTHILYLLFPSRGR